VRGWGLLVGACAVLWVACGTALAAPGAPAHLTVDQLAEPLAVEGAAPLLGWQDDHDQSAYEVKVAAAGGAPVWDPGKVDSSDSQDVPYAGPALQPGTRYEWSVRTWDGHGAAGPWSEPAQFGTALKSLWQATPIWAAPAGPAGWSDYTVAVDVQVTSKSAGIVFRAADSRDYYMFQVRSDDDTLDPHRQVNGTFTKLAAVKLPMSIGTATHHVAIQVAGATITTFIDGVQVDTRTDPTFSAGSIGFRHGSTESAVYDNVKVTAADGRVLYSDDFSDPADADFAGCGSVSGGALVVGKGKACVLGAGSVSNRFVFARREFHVADKPVAWATAYVTGRSTEPTHQYVYRLALNGAFVGVGPTRSADDAHTTMYDAFDVTSRLRRGQQNALGALAYATADQRFLAQLVIQYADGTRDVVATDGSWRVLAGGAALPDGASVGTSYHDQPAENVDARRYPFGFAEPGFDDPGWTAPQLKPAIGGLQGTEIANVVEQDVAPQQVVEVAPGHYFVDFGRTIMGGLRLHMDGTAGQQVQILYGEEKSGPTSVRYQLRAGNVYKDTWTLKDGAQTLSLWGYRTFRYAEVIGAPDGTGITGDALVYPYDPGASSFSSSVPALDQLFAFARDGVRALNLNLHTDSPTRETAPYEGDDLIQLQVQGATDGDYALSRYTIGWLIQNPTWPTEWKYASILSAYEYWQATGDTRLTAQFYDRLAAFLPTGEVNAQGLVQETDTSNDLVDWPAGERDGYVFTTINTVENEWAYRSFADMAALAASIGNTADADRYGALAERLRAAINANLWDPASGAYRDGLTTTHEALHASVFALAFGVAGARETGPAADYVAGRGIACGVFCANFLVDGLLEAGRGADAVRLLTSTGTRSWLHMIALGAGSPMEAWDPSLKSNTTFSHAWSAGPAYLTLRGLLGLAPLAPGWSRFAVAPAAGLDSATAVTPTARGPVMASFARGAGGLDVAVDVPGNATARVTLGTGTVWVDHRPVTASADGTVDVGAGCHVLSTRTAGNPADSVMAPALARGCPAVTQASGDVGGTVPATLSLTLGPVPSLGTFTPGVAQTYEAAATATVTSTAADATLSVSDPAAATAGHLVNGRFALASPLQLRAGDGLFAPLGAGSLTLRSWDGPVSNDATPLGFRQPIAADEPLRTGAYAKTLTFTLATTSP
jgi:alpha-L-rhamnosidase